MTKIRFIARFFLVTAMLLSVVGKVQALPPLPSHFHGEIHVLDNPPVVGSTINAYVPGVVAPVGSTTVTNSGGILVYSIDVAGDEPDTPAKDGGLEGDTITFRFGTRSLGTWFWHSGTDVNLNFHPPQAIAGGPYTGNEGSAFTFAGSAADYASDAANYYWDMDSDPLTFEITGQNPVITFPNSGTFTVRLWVTDGLVGEGFAPATVNVANVAPTVAAYSPSVSTNEGTTANNGGTYSDPGNDISTITASVGSVINHGDGTWAWVYTPTDGPTQSQTVTVTATDADGATGITTFSLVVNNVAPVGSLGNTGPVAEGSPVTISFTNQGDASPEDVSAGIHYAFACDGGSLSGSNYGNSSTSSSTTCTFSEPPTSHIVRARIIDKDDGTTEYTTSVLVTNANPIVNRDQATVTVNEGVTATNTGTISDPGGDTVILSASPVGTVVNNGNGTWSWSFATTAGPSESQTITIQAVDPQGGFSGVTFTLVVNNVPPTAIPGGPYTANEGSPVNFVGSAYDPGADDIGSLEYEWDFDYISPNFIAEAWAPSVSPTYSDAGSYVAALRVIDSQFATGIATTNVTINNTPPISASAGGPYNVAPNTLLNMNGSYNCVSVDICTTYAWDLDNDGQFEDATGIIASYTWTVDGVYPISFRVTDDDGTSAVGSTTVTVGSVFSYSVPLVVGWNLVSFNLHPTNTATEVVLANISGHYDLVYAWDATGGHAGAGNWLRFDPLTPFLATLTTLTEAQGFWIHMTTADTLNVSGTIVATSNISLLDNVGGWNLVGYPSTTTRALPAAIPTEATLIYAYHAADTSDLWKLYDRNGLPFLNDLANLTPGWGYWVFVTADSTWGVAY